MASVYGSYPLIRSRNTNLYAGLAFDAKTFQDKRPLNLDMPVEDKKAQVLMASTYPVDFQAAVTWSKAHPDEKGDAAIAEDGGAGHTADAAVVVLDVLHHNLLLAKRQYSLQQPELFRQEIAAHTPLDKLHQALHFIHHLANHAAISLQDARL